MRWSLITLLCACNPLPDTVKLTGSVRDDLPEEAGPFAGASLRVLDAAGERVGSGRTDATGRFSVDVPAGTDFHLVVEGSGHVPAAFSGVSGLEEEFAVDDGLLHGLSEVEWAAWTTAFAGCPGVGEGGAVIGEPRALELVDEQGQHPGVAAAVAEIYDPRTEQVIATACYLDAETGLYDPDAAATGAAGVFAIFGVEEGTWVLSVGFEAWPDAWTWEDTLVFVPEGGAAPRFPAWVHFPVR